MGGGGGGGGGCTYYHLSKWKLFFFPFSFFIMPSPDKKQHLYIVVFWVHRGNQHSDYCIAVSTVMC